MQSIEIDFEVYKALTARRTGEGDSPNDVLRRLLGLGQGNVIRRHIDFGQILRARSANGPGAANGQK